MKFAKLPEGSKERAREALCSSLGNSYLISEEEAVLAGKAVSAAFIAMERYDDAPDVCGDKATVTDSNDVERGCVGRDGVHVGDRPGKYLVSVTIDTSELEAQVTKINYLLRGLCPDAIDNEHPLRALVGDLANHIICTDEKFSDNTGDICFSVRFGSAFSTLVTALRLAHTHQG